MSNFQVGDVVRLKSGSLPMTVNNTEFSQEIGLDYWDGNAFVSTHFPATSLEKTDKTLSLDGAVNLVAARGSMTTKVS